MKKFLPSVKALAFYFLFSIISTVSFSQVTVVSTAGYSVTVNVQPIAILTTATDCQWGYGYTVKLNYSITFAGNRPPALYDIQGTVGDGSKAIYFDLPEVGGVL